MAKFKYIILDDGTMEIPIVFSKFLQHKTIAEQMGFEAYKNGKFKVVSAGFVKIDYNVGRDSNEDELSFNCFGESVSLKIKSREKVDEEIIKKDYKFEM